MKRTKKIFWGLYFIAAAVFLLAAKLTGFADTSVGVLVACVLLLAVLIQSIIGCWIPGIVFPIAFVAILFDEQLGITAITPWYLLGAALLLSIGLSMIFHKHHDWSNCAGIHHHDQYASTEEYVDGSDFSWKNTFGATIKYVQSDDFRSTDLSNSFGSMTVYFDKAEIKEGTQAKINVDVSFGAIELYIPKQWNMKIDAHAAFGAIDEKNRKEYSAEPVVLLGGNVSFGAVEIYYV